MATLTSVQLGDLANTYTNFANQLFNYKITHFNTLTVTESADLSNRINLILHNASLLSAISTYTTLSDITSQLNDIKQASIDITHVLTVIITVQKAVDLATLVVKLGTSILSFNVEGIVDNTAALADAIAAIVNGGIGAQ